MTLPVNAKTAPAQRGACQIAHHVAIVGAGIAGLAAAIDLAAQGHRVTLLERAATPGGKLRQLTPGTRPIDAGPTVFTMRWVFEELFAAAGTNLIDHLTLAPLTTLARHAWSATERLDLFADADRSADAIAAFASPTDARAYREFAASSQRTYDTLERPFLRAPQPGSPLALIARAGILPTLRIAAFATLWRRLEQTFADPRLRQLFARYATYTGSSPYLAPATLMLIAHVERAGVWRVQGGMHALAQALANLAISQGATLRTNTHVTEIALERGRARHLHLATGETLTADAIILNADAAALADGLFGAPAARALRRPPIANRSLSALTWAIETAPIDYPLHHHTVFFGPHYRAEFDDILTRHRLPHSPTVYVCAQDRDDACTPPSTPTERLLILVNAPPSGDHRPPTEQELAECQTTTRTQLASCGVNLPPNPPTIRTGPAEFNSLYPATGGALYGQATHGPTASFRRPGSATKIPGLYLAGGSAHPGAGVPMAALSGRLAAARLLADLTSPSPSRRTATPGGTSTRSATTADTASPSSPSSAASSPPGTPGPAAAPPPTPKTMSPSTSCCIPPTNPPAANAGR